MNPVAVALERAAAIAKRGDDLPALFDAEWAKVEFAPDAESVVVPVPEEHALEWFEDRLTDLELCLVANPAGKAIWWAGLPRIGRYRAGLEQVKSLHAAGARAMIFQTENPVLIQHAHRHGFFVNRLDDGKTRLRGNAQSLASWLA